MIKLLLTKRQKEGILMALMYCKKCGRLVIGHYNDKDESPCYCDCCEAITYKVPKEFLLEGGKVPIINSDLEQQFIEEYVKCSPEFDQQAFDNRDKILAEKRARYNYVMERGRAILEGRGGTPKCPTCGTTNISKIGFISRAVSTSLFGLASNKIGKTYKCNSCGTTW